MSNRMAPYPLWLEDLSLHLLWSPVARLRSSVAVVHYACLCDEDHEKAAHLLSYDCSRNNNAISLRCVITLADSEVRYSLLQMAH